MNQFIVTGIRGDHTKILRIDKAIDKTQNKQTNQYNSKS